MSALEALCDYALYKSTFTFTLHYITLLELIQHMDVGQAIKLRLTVLEYANSASPRPRKKCPSAAVLAAAMLARKEKVANQPLVEEFLELVRCCPADKLTSVAPSRTLSDRSQSSLTSAKRPI